MGVCGEFAEMIKLDIPYKSQLENKARNDCGAAAGAMLTGVSVDRFLEIVEQPPDKALTFADIMRGLEHFGITWQYKRPLYLPVVKSELALGHPVVILANYSVVPRPQVSFDGAHYFLAVGCDEEGVLVHDPLWRDERGAYLRLADGPLDYAMKQPGWGNQAYQGLIVERVYPFVGKEAPPTVDWRARALAAEGRLAAILAILEGVS